jgi:hypothetical protein
MNIYFVTLGRNPLSGKNMRPKLQFKFGWFPCEFTELLSVTVTQRLLFSNRFNCKLIAHIDAFIAVISCSYCYLVNYSSDLVLRLSGRSRYPTLMRILVNKTHPSISVRSEYMHIPAFDIVWYQTKNKTGGGNNSRNLFGTAAYA